MQNHELTGLILTHQERDISPIIGQLSTICGQLVVVHDSRTGDFTMPNLPDAIGDTVDIIDRPFDTFPAQRNAGIDKALGSWVLSVDSDEMPSVELLDEIQKLDPGTETDVYAIPRSEQFGRKLLGHAHPYGTTHYRLFRSEMRYAPQPVVHEELTAVRPEAVSALVGVLHHQPADTFVQRLEKSFHYGQIHQDATDNDAPSWLRVGLTLPALCSRDGFWRDGISGFAMAAVHTSFKLGTKFARPGGR